MSRVRPRAGEGRRDRPRPALAAAGAALLLAAGHGAARAGTYFGQHPPGAALPSARTCARAVAAHPMRENRPDNRAPNHRTWHAGARIDGVGEGYNARYAPRVRGDYTGTTGDILRWAACKWGLDDDVTMARAVAESKWHQSTVGDQGQSFGILQVKRTVHEGTYPGSERSTAYNADYAGAWQRACLDHEFAWLGRDYLGSTGSRLTWGCVGAWYSGEWYRGNASYIVAVRRIAAERPWREPGF